jgi:hypothetical protein
MCKLRQGKCTRPGRWSHRWTSRKPEACTNRLRRFRLRFTGARDPDPLEPASPVDPPDPPPPLLPEAQGQQYSNTLSGNGSATAAHASAKAGPGDPVASLGPWQISPNLFAEHRFRGVPWTVKDSTAA